MSLRILESPDPNQPVHIFPRSPRDGGLSLKFRSPTTFQLGWPQARRDRLLMKGRDLRDGMTGVPRGGGRGKEEGERMK